MQHIGMVRFSDVDVVRHPLVQRIVRAYDERDARREIVRAERRERDGRRERSRAPESEEEAAEEPSS